MNPDEYPFDLDDDEPEEDPFDEERTESQAELD